MRTRADSSPVARLTEEFRNSGASGYHGFVVGVLTCSRDCGNQGCPQKGQETATEGVCTLEHL